MVVLENKKGGGFETVPSRRVATPGRAFERGYSREMSSIQQVPESHSDPCVVRDDRGAARPSASPLAHAFVNSIRAISAERTQEREDREREIERLVGDFLTVRELLRASIDALAEKTHEYDRLHYNYIDLLVKHRAYMSGTTDYEERMKIDEQREMQLVIDRYEARRAQQREAA